MHALRIGTAAPQDMSRRRPQNGFTRDTTRNHGISDVVPRYYQVYSVLQQRIRAGVWPPEGPMPTEEAFAAEFGVSRERVRQIEAAALRKLRRAAERSA